MNLKEIEARHAIEDAHAKAEWPHGAGNYGDTRPCHADRAWLLAEVKRLKALCGRAHLAIEAIHEAGWAGPEASHFVGETELKEAASE